MSEQNVETVKRAVGALNERDIERYLGCCTEDIELRTPLAEVGGVYEGADAIRRFWADSGLAVLNELPTTNVYDFAGGKIRRIRVFRDRQDALEAVGVSE
jgi:ketosteroid isomerase-like protein